MGLVITGVVNALWMQPLMQLTFGLIGVILSPLAAWFS